MQRKCPSAVSAFYMAYLQNRPQSGEPATPAAAGADASQMPSTRASALPAKDGGQAVPAITFLYRLTPGIADRSFGLNVARLARLPPSVIAQAAVQAAAMEEASAARTAPAAGPPRPGAPHASLLRQLQEALLRGCDQPALLRLQGQARTAVT